MYAVTSPEGVLVAMVATMAEANDSIFNHVLKGHGEEGVIGCIDPLFSFVDLNHLTPAQARELERTREGMADYYGYTVEELKG